MKLQILVTRHNETWEEIKPLLDSLSLQIGIDFSEIGVLIGDDGSDEHLKEITGYPFEVTYYWREHESTSAIRNFLLDTASGDYVMYCDSDDMFFDMRGIRTIFSYIADGGFDVLCSLFLEEVKRNGKSEFIAHEHDVQFVHGKVYRREYLITKDVRHDEKLTGAHQDGYFNRLARAMTTNRKYCSTPFYLWKWRKDSVARGDPKHMLKTYVQVIDAVEALAEEFERREMHDKALESTAGIIFDTYYTLMRQNWKSEENAEYLAMTEKRFAEFFEKHRKWWEEVPDYAKAGMSQRIRERSIRKGMRVESETLEQWISRLIKE